MEKNPFLKYLIKEKKEDILHTSAYAKVQNGEGFGASSSQSFEDRQKIEANRQIVRGYNDSKLMQQARVSAPRAATYTRPVESSSNRFDSGVQRSGMAQSGAMAQNSGMRGGVPQSGGMRGSIAQGAGMRGGATQNRPPVQRINPGITRK